MYILMPDDIGYYKYKKQVHELKVGKAMYEWYGKEERLLNTVRQVVAYSFLRYFELIGLDPWMGENPPLPPKSFPCYVNLLGILPGSNKNVGMVKKTKTLEVIKNLLAKEKFLLVWGKYCPGAPGKHTARDLGKVLIKYPEWSVSDCSELVRFWGGLVEEIGKALGKNMLGTELNDGQAAQIALRLDDVRKRSRGDSADFIKREKDGWWKPPYDRKKPQNETPAEAERRETKELMMRYRLQMQREAHKKVPDGGVRDRQYSKDRQTPRYLRDYVFPGDPPAGKDDSDKWVRGCSLLKPVNPSLVKHLDDVFGLWEGADISGTTTDFVGCFEAAWMMVFEGVLAANNEPSKLNAALEVMTWCFPYFALLAPAAMIYGFHHTTYEIGVALSLAYGVDYGDSAEPVFDYHIGFYDTLVPNITHVTSGSSGTASKVMAKGRAEEARLKNTLTRAIKSVEKKKDDNPCLVSLIDDKGALYGGYLLSDDERKKHKAWFQSVYVHRMSLDSGAHGYSQYLLNKINPDYKKELAGEYFKKY
ncbi:MAG: hypothetical protein LJE89_02025 [Deltaproteobacteria bacterium]|nr:hypothetical protein [Deltaproteobacteria bacterium]